MRVLALIPARSGSKGLLDKNIRLMNGKPMFAWTIEAALQSGVCDEVMVSTDSSHYAELAKKYGAKVPFLRSHHNSSDISPSIDCVLEVLDFYGTNVFDVLIFLQPTSPLRNSFDIREAYSVFIAGGMRGLASVSLCKKHPSLARELSDGELHCFGCCDGKSQRRQDLPTMYELNGAIYINKVSDIDKNTVLNFNVVPYLMPPERSFDVDTEMDFLLAETVLSRIFFDS